jgi:hypothetical protein
MTPPDPMTPPMTPSRCGLVPFVGYVDIVWIGRAFPGFDKRFYAHQKERPLGAAMVHELNRLLPALVFEEDNGEVLILREREAYLCADPFLGPAYHFPQHALGGIKLEYLHVDTAARPKAELDHSADIAVTLRVGCPPAGKTFPCGQCPIVSFSDDLIATLCKIFGICDFSFLFRFLCELQTRTLVALGTVGTADVFHGRLLFLDGEVRLVKNLTDLNHVAFVGGAPLRPFHELFF